MKTNTYNIALCALMTAIMCILGPLSVPIGPIPISLTNLVIYLAIYILKIKKTLISYLVYLLLGMIGLPVFSGFEGGMQKLVGPTGGYLLGFFAIILIAGFVFEKTRQNTILTGIAMIIGTLVAYALGTAWFMFETQRGIIESLTLCVYPFIPFDIIKIIMATVLGIAIRKAMQKANLIR